MAEAPKFEGPLINEQWSPAEDYTFEEAAERTSQGLAREEALGVPVGSTHEIPYVDLGNTKPENNKTKKSKRDAGKPVRGRLQLLVKDTPTQAHVEATKRVKEGSGLADEEDKLIGAEQGKAIVDDLERRKMKKLLERNNVDPPAA